MQRQKHSKNAQAKRLRGLYLQEGAQNLLVEVVPCPGGLIHMASHLQVIMCPWKHTKHPLIFFFLIERQEGACERYTQFKKEQDGFLCICWEVKELTFLVLSWPPLRKRGHLRAMQVWWAQS